MKDTITVNPTYTYNMNEKRSLKHLLCKHEYITSNVSKNYDDVVTDYEITCRKCGSHKLCVNAWAID